MNHKDEENRVEQLGEVLGQVSGETMVMLEESRESTESRIQVYIPSSLGLSASCMVAREALEHPCVIWLERDGTRVNSRKVIDLLSLKAPTGTRLVIIACGEGAENAVKAMATMISCGFRNWRREVTPRGTAASRAEK